MARTPLTARVVCDEHAKLTTVVVSRLAPNHRVTALAKRVNILVSPAAPGRNEVSRIHLRWLLEKLGRENVSSLLVEGGGEVNASFLMGGFAHRVAFFYAPRILGGRESSKAVAGVGIKHLSKATSLSDVVWRKLGEDLLLTARVLPKAKTR